MNVVLLKDIAETSSGGTPSRENRDFYGGNILWVKSGELRDGFITKTEETITEMGLQNSSAKLFPLETLLIALYGATVGKLGILKIAAATNQAVCAIFTSPKVEKRFLFFYLLSQRENIISKSTGGAQPNISQEIIQDLQIPLPPLPEQKRIAAILDKADRLRRQRRYAQTLSDSFLQSVFIKMFGDKRKFDIVELESLLAESPKNGLYLPAEKYGRGTPIIRIDNFYAGILDSPVNFKRVLASPKEIEEFKVQNGHILVNRVNSLEYLGKCAYVQGIKENTVFESNMMRLAVNRNLVRAIYLVTYLTSEHGKSQILTCAKKAVNQASINQTDVESFLVPLPPLPLQEKFAAIVQKFERIRRQQREATRQAEHLFQTLLHRAFRGEL